MQRPRQPRDPARTFVLAGCRFGNVDFAALLGGMAERFKAQVLKKLPKSLKNRRKTREITLRTEVLGLLE